jgi:ubiquinone biosynthesis protein COQ4
MTPRTASSGYDLPRALRAVKALIDNPDDTSQAFRVVDALPGRAPERNLRRFAATPVGARVLAERRSLMAALTDRARLEALPEGSVGRAYLRFMNEEAITADGLVEASITGADRPRVAGSDRDVLDTWIRDSHDLWHTVTGYKGDLIGEASLLAFSFAQTRHPGVGLIVLAALLRVSFAPLEPGSEVERATVRRMIVQGFMRGLRAEWLVAQDWEALLEQPLDEVRRQLGLGDAPSYAPVRTRDLEHALS